MPDSILDVSLTFFDVSWDALINLVQQLNTLTQCISPVQQHLHHTHQPDSTSPYSEALQAAHIVGLAYTWAGCEQPHDQRA